MTALQQKDRDVLRELAELYAEIAALPVQREKAAAWRGLNDLEGGRPLVWMNEIPWEELNAGGELTIECADPFLRGIEGGFRRALYQWRHMRGDMVIEPVCYAPLAIRDSGFGIREESDLIAQGKGGIRSHGFHPQIREEKDLEKIRTPVLTHDEEASARNLQTLRDAIGDILPVKPCGIVSQWFAPWDELIRWWGVQEALMDLVLRPELVHAAMDRLVNACLVRLDQWEALNLLSLTEGNYRVGSGGYGYCSAIPAEGFDPARVRPKDQWGCATAQIFSDVSPEMHEEFALRYERRWLERFGITYYGCCEPLHNKLEILRSVPNLRKISMSPWANVDKYVALTEGRYVLSHKPNPAILAEDRWHPQRAKAELEKVLEKTRGLCVEVILKDISTVRSEPRRLWEWAEMAVDLCERRG